MKYILVIFIVLASLGIGYYFGSHAVPIVQPPIISTKPSEIWPLPTSSKEFGTDLQKLMMWYKLSDSERNWEMYNVAGNSMVEYGINSGDMFIVNRGKCQVGDFCVFQCLADKCHKETLIKKLVKTSDKGYWFEGNPDKNCPEGVDNCASFDSRDYGWLGETEFNFVGSTTLENRFSL